MAKQEDVNEELIQNLEGLIEDLEGFIEDLNGRIADLETSVGLQDDLTARVEALEVFVEEDAAAVLQLAADIKFLYRAVAGIGIAAILVGILSAFAR